MRCATHAPTRRRGYTGEGTPHPPIVGAKRVANRCSGPAAAESRGVPLGPSTMPFEFGWHVQRTRSPRTPMFGRAGRRCSDTLKYRGSTRPSVPIPSALQVRPGNRAFVNAVGQALVAGLSRALRTLAAALEPSALAHRMSVGGGHRGLRAGSPSLATVGVPPALRSWSSTPAAPMTSPASHDG